MAHDIAARLGANYGQNPRLEVFVEEYKSRQAAVTGSVSKPGLYPLTKGAGGIMDLIPAQGPGAHSAAFDVATAGAITIDMSELLRGGNHASLSFPIVAGDVIYVPRQGPARVIVVDHS